MLKLNLESFFLKIWYEKNWLFLILIPLSWLFCAVVYIRKLAFKVSFLKSTILPVPTIVVGNISVGGTGKTILIIDLVEKLTQAGFKPGVISRGFASNLPNGEVKLVTENSLPSEVGDEPVLIFRRTQVPLMVGSDRVSAARKLLATHNCNVILSDDGLQHYQLHRDIEIILLDGDRLLGNGNCLPAGPLREPVSRLKKATYVLVKQADSELGLTMGIKQLPLYNSLDRSIMHNIKHWSGTKLHVVSGIGNPDALFNKISEQGITVIKHALPDHFNFTNFDFNFGDGLPIFVTEKDAVKINSQENIWVLPVCARIENSFYKDIVARL